MVTIYALIDPRNNMPFYVGQTTHTYSRLVAHRNAIKYITPQTTEVTIKRKQLIDDIESIGEAVEIRTLLICSKKAANKCERYVFNLLTDAGYTLLQYHRSFNRNYPVITSMHR